MSDETLALGAAKHSCVDWKVVSDARGETLTGGALGRTVVCILYIAPRCPMCI